MKITFWQKINPIFWFGNLDDPNPPNDYRPNDSAWKRKVWWYFRNPLHNLCFYVLGIADKPFISIGKYPNTVFNPNGGWNWAIRKYKWIYLPFISYIGKIKCYIGWRERGNWGVKLTNNKDNK